MNNKRKKKGCHYLRVSLRGLYPVNFTILDLEDPKWKNDWQTVIYTTGGTKTQGLY
jgi:hypothetical protein